MRHLAADGSAATAAIPVKAQKGKANQQTDEEFLASLRSDPTYSGLDIDQEAGKARRWCQANRRQCNRRFFTNWLNRATSDRAMLLPLGGQGDLQVVNGGQQATSGSRIRRDGTSYTWEKPPTDEEYLDGLKNNPFARRIA